VLEQTARMSPQEIAEYATQFTIDGFMAGRIYNVLRRDDFCDVVLAALARQLLDPQ